jgi:hypothetical protein
MTVNKVSGKWQKKEIVASFLAPGVCLERGIKARIILNADPGGHAV